MCFVGKKSRHLKNTITQDVFKAMFFIHIKHIGISFWKKSSAYYHVMKWLLI